MNLQVSLNNAKRFLEAKATSTAASKATYTSKRPTKNANEPPASTFRCTLLDAIRIKMERKGESEDADDNRGQAPATSTTDEAKSSKSTAAITTKPSDSNNSSFDVDVDVVDALFGDAPIDSTELSPPTNPLPEVTDEGARDLDSIYNSIEDIHYYELIRYSVALMWTSTVVSDTTTNIDIQQQQQQQQDDCIATVYVVRDWTARTRQQGEQNRRFNEYEEIRYKLALGSSAVDAAPTPASASTASAMASLSAKIGVESGISSANAVAEIAELETTDIDFENDPFAFLRGTNEIIAQEEAMRAAVVVNQENEAQQRREREREEAYSQFQQHQHQQQEDDIDWSDILQNNTDTEKNDNTDADQQQQDDDKTKKKPKKKRKKKPKTKPGEEPVKVSRRRKYVEFTIEEYMVRMRQMWNSQDLDPQQRLQQQQEQNSHFGYNQSPASSRSNSPAGSPPGSP